MCRKIALFGLRAEILLARSQGLLDSRAGPFLGSVKKYWFFVEIFTSDSWVIEKEQRESSNVEEEALNVDIIHEEGQEVREAAWEKEKEEEDQGSGEPDLKKRKSFYDSSLRWTEMMF